ncbi:hypothetical protein ILYODFUR_030446 [Ilyodon furcidens]|uniref:Uncharacterized protein n=1 Tax=Ilyodon furcidens TaxID=33524 RepID=A0ABV0VK21_9TELE
MCVSIPEEKKNIFRRWLKLMLIIIHREMNPVPTWAERPLSDEKASTLKATYKAILQFAANTHRDKGHSFQRYVLWSNETTQSIILWACFVAGETGALHQIDGIHQIQRKSM